MRGVHIDDNQSGCVLRQDVHAVNLRQRVAQRKFSVRSIGERCRGRGIARTEQRAIERFGLPGGGWKRRLICTSIDVRIGARHRPQCTRKIRHLPCRNRFQPRAGRRRGRVLSGPRQVLAQCALNELMHRVRFAETHLGLAWMHVDVDQFRGDFEEQHEGRMAVAVHHVRIGRAYGMCDQLVADKSAIDEHKLLVTCGTRVARERSPSGERKRRSVVRHVDENRSLGKRLAQHGPGAFHGRAAFDLKNAAAVVRERERHMRRGQGDAVNGVLAVTEFGHVGFQEFASRGCIEK